MSKRRKGRVSKIGVTMKSRVSEKRKRRTNKND